MRNNSNNNKVVENIYNYSYSLAHAEKRLAASGSISSDDKMLIGQFILPITVIGQDNIASTVVVATAA